MVLVFAIASTGFSTADLLVGQSDNVIRHVRNGTFDVVLLRPLSVLGQLATTDLQLRRLGRVSVSLLLLVVVLVRLDLDWTPARVAMVVVAPIAATVVFGALFVAAGGVDVLGGRRDRGDQRADVRLGVPGPVADRGADPGAGPILHLRHPGRLHRLPAGAGAARQARPDRAAGWLPWASPVAAVAAAAAAGLVWRSGIRHYVGAGG